MTKQEIEQAIENGESVWCLYNYVEAKYKIILEDVCYGN